MQPRETHDAFGWNQSTTADTPSAVRFHALRDPQGMLLNLAAYARAAGE
jgi:hypothetical protein